MRFLTPLILIGIAVAVFFGYTDNQYRILKDKMATLSHIEEAKKNAEELNKQRQDLLEARNKISQEDIDKLNKMLPDTVENVGLIIEINNIALKNGLGYVKNPQVNQGGTGKASKGPDAIKYGSLTMSFNVSGTYDQIQKFLQDLETYVRLVDVVGLTFTANKEGRYDYNVTIQTYWLK